MLIVKDPSVIVKSGTALKALFLYFVFKCNVG